MNKHKYIQKTARLELEHWLKYTYDIIVFGENIRPCACITIYNFREYTQNTYEVVAYKVSPKYLSLEDVAKLVLSEWIPGRSVLFSHWDDHRKRFNESFKPNFSLQPNFFKCFACQETRSGRPIHINMCAIYGKTCDKYNATIPDIEWFLKKISPELVICVHCEQKRLYPSWQLIDLICAKSIHL